MSETLRCPKCGAPLPADSPAGLCPNCLVAAGLESDPAGAAEPERTTPFTPSGGAFVPPPPEQLADRFAELEILGLLGTGGMGAVYQARQKELDRLVAVKILPPEVGADPAFAERFSREAKALARLGHPNIVAVYDAGQRDGLFYFVMEYVDGVSLREAMRTGDIEPQQALSIVAQICEALQYAHDAGIVHRDIKPENVLLTKDGRVKIADFGLAKLVREAAADMSLTGTAEVMGTFRYMAPEQLEGAAHVDHRADIYSLGVVFYELLTGEVPMGRFEPPSKKVEVDIRLDEVVLHSLEREPERRYQQASEVKTDVDSISSGASKYRASTPDSMGVHTDVLSRDPTKPTPGRIGAWLTTSSSWIVLFAVLSSLSCLFPWKEIELGVQFDERMFVFILKGYELWRGQLVAGIGLLLAIVLVMDGVRIQPIPIWRMLMSVCAALAMIAILTAETHSRRSVLYSTADIAMYETLDPEGSAETRREFADWSADVERRGLKARARKTSLYGIFLSIGCSICLLLAACVSAIIDFVVPRWSSRSAARTEPKPANNQPQVCQMAVIGACVLLLAILAAGLLSAFVFTEGQRQPGYNRWQQSNDLWEAIWLGFITLVTMAAATALGWLAIVRIKHSKSRLFGMPLAVGTALIFPILLLDALIIFPGMMLGEYVWADVLHGFAPEAPGIYQVIPFVILAPFVVAAILIDFFLVRAVLRNATGYEAPREESTASTC